MWTCPKPTILKLLVDLGTACAEFHNERVRNLHAQRIQCDNFARIHGTLRVTPAMATGIADHVWSLEELVGLLDRASTEAA